MDKLVLITLLVKLGVAAAIASALVRSREYQNLLFTEERTLGQKAYLALFTSLPFALGVLVRVATPNFLAADLTFEAVILMGVVGGEFAGVFAGILCAIPAVLHGELLALPFNIVVGFVAGLLRNYAEEREMIWSFSPFVDLSLYRWFRKVVPWPKIDWQVAFFAVIVGLSVLRWELYRLFPRYIFSLNSGNPWVMVLVFLTIVFCVGIPLKIWNNARIERKLQEQEQLLLQARMEALQSQINPHFLFNTLNTISSLVRFDPDTAREMIVKLATILRRLLRKTDAFVPLRDEISFIDDYLDIEVVRFGRDKLKVIKQLEPASLEILVPSMMLQPLVENSIKHGLSPKVEGGSITLRSRSQGDRLTIEVEDDGVGMAGNGFLERPRGIGGSGIGMANVAERLRVLFGETARMMVENSPSGGTLIRITIPIYQAHEVAQGVSGVLQEARSNTLR
ncbi:MAG TPA: histidine kinase [Terriglobales bacterium]|nr:histidine kinase [Terriglobales bacterium]